jgi:hypothetical protein
VVTQAPGLSLVLGRFLHMINNEDFNRAFARFELQSELFLKGGKDRWLESAANSPGAGPPGAPGECLVAGEFQMHIKCPSETSLIDDSAAQEVR